jgi:hypothetical protein
MIPHVHCTLKRITTKLKHSKSSFKVAINCGIDAQFFSEVRIDSDLDPEGECIEDDDEVNDAHETREWQPSSEEDERRVNGERHCWDKFR